MANADKTDFPPTIPRRREKRRSPYFAVKVTALGLVALWLLWVSFATYASFAHNSQGEFCAYVKPGEPYHLMLDDGPCRITASGLDQLVGVFLVVGVLIQVPTLGLWAVIATLEGWRKYRRSRNGPTAVRSDGRLDDEGHG